MPQSKTHNVKGGRFKAKQRQIRDYLSGNWDEIKTITKGNVSLRDLKEIVEKGMEKQGFAEVKPSHNTVRKYVLEIADVKGDSEVLQRFGPAGPAPHDISKQKSQPHCHACGTEMELRGVKGVDGRYVPVWVCRRPLCGGAEVRREIWLCPICQGFCASTNDGWRCLNHPQCRGARDANGKAIPGQA